MKGKKRVLIVDDDTGIRRSLSRILRAQDLITFEAADGAEAVKIVGSEHLDLAILDIRMPGIDGVDTFQAMRAIQPTLPAIFMTAYSTSQRATAASLAGGLCVMMKPLKLDELLRVITRAVESAPVLVVDNDEGFLRSLARALDTAGLSSVTVSSLQRATAELRQRPDRIVIADVFLDDGNGLDLLKQYSVGPPPLILVTGHADWYESSNAESALASSKVSCLPKPIDITVLLGLIRTLQTERSAVSSPERTQDQDEAL